MKKCVVESLLVVQVSGVKHSVAKGSISKLRDLSVYKMVMIEGKSAVRHSLVPGYQVRTK